MIYPSFTRFKKYEGYIVIFDVIYSEVIMFDPWGTYLIRLHLQQIWKYLQYGDLQPV